MPVRRKQQLPENVDDLDGITKAAIILLVLDSDQAGSLLQALPAETVEDVTKALASMGEIPAQLTQAVISEFYSLSLAQQHSNDGGLDYASMLLRKSLDPKQAEKVIQQIETQVQKTPFSFLQKAQSENLLTFIKDEHPQTIALIVSHMSHHKASEILAGLEGPKQLEVVRRIANMEQTNPEIIREVESGLEHRLSNMLMSTTEKVGGVETVAEMLNLCDRTTERAIMESIESDDPELVESIRKLMFVFEDILLVDDKGIQSVLKEIDNEELCLALKTASDDLKEKVFSNMSSRAADLLKEDMEYMGPVRVSDVETAQQRVVDTVRRLEESGEIIVSGRGGQSDIVV